MRQGGTAVLAGLVLCGWMSCAWAQPAGRMPRVGYIGFQGEPAHGSPLRDAFVRGLREHGYLPGQSVMLEVRRYDTDGELRQAIADLVRLKMDLLMVGPPAAAAAARQATRQIPIVCGSCGDPVENGLAASLARPGGNVTGLASLSAELIGKRVALMRELFPDTPRAAVLVFPANPGTGATLSALQSAAANLGIELRQFEIRGASDFEPAFRAAAGSGARGVVVQDDPITRTVRSQIAQLGLRYRLAVSSGVLELADAGVFMAYGPDRVEMVRRAASIADKILKGAKPAELPFEQVSTLELVVNLRTAKAIGVTIPQSFLLRATRTIE